MKRGILAVMAGITALSMLFTGCECLTISNVDANNNEGSGHYYVDMVPASGLPVVEQLNNGNPTGTAYKIAEAFNKYDAIYLVGAEGVAEGITVAVPPGKTLYVAPGSSVARFDVAAGLSGGNITARDTGLSAGAGPGTLVVLDGATMPLSGDNALGGLLQVNKGGLIKTGGPSASITGSGRVVVGGKVAVDSITVAGGVHVAQGDGERHGVVQADIDTTYLSPPTFVPTVEGIINGNSSRSHDDYYAFENAEPDPSRDVRVDGVVIGNIKSGGHVHVAENNRVSLLNNFYGYVAGPAGGDGPSDATIISYGNAEILGNVLGKIIAKGAVTVGSRSGKPHRAQVRSGIYSRTGDVVIKKRAASGDIVAYQGKVTIEKGGAATGIDTYYGNYDNGDSRVNRGNVIVMGRVENPVSDSYGPVSSGSGETVSGGSVELGPYGGSGDFGADGYISGNVSARRSATIDGVVLGNLDTANSNFDETAADTQNILVNGSVGGRVTAGGALAVADHHEGQGNVNAGSLNGIYANGYVGGGAAVHGRHGTGPSIIRGLVENGSLYVGDSATVAIAGSGRVNTFGSSGVEVNGTLVIETSGELDVDMISEISSHYISFTDVHVFAHAESLASGGRLGPPGSGIALMEGARIYTQTPIAVPTLANLNTDSGIQSGAAVDPDELDRRFKALAGSAVIHTNVAPPASLGVAAPLDFTVGLHNSVTLTRNTTLAGSITVNGLLRLNGYELAASGAITLGSDHSPLFNYGGTDQSNGSIRL